ncbi:Hypothetical predicted protein [Olea europaea subsp. europaea]|uniref:BZIP domain-containing protein n=1 Tax=Olea europaea subsp. europaea TaxID=158383 RepID=A0A8S0QLA1_OLEEU|nr:Hypothetical predicted protein [Olea europaea subsp. europaea]
MSRQAHLPPRCPDQKKTVTRPAYGPVSPTLCSIELHPGAPRHHKSISQSSIFEEQPAWLNDLLSDSDSDSSGILHRRSASDSFTLFDGLGPLPSLDQLDGLNTPDSCEPENEFESGCAYGPISPRRKDNVAFPENAIVSALSEYVLQSPLQHWDASMCVSGTAQPNSIGGALASASGTNTETKLMKRHPGQRSRVRKLQYIAELERTIDILQNLESDLAVRVTSLYERRLALSMENNTLKQQVVRLQKERFNVEGKQFIFLLIVFTCY